MWEKTFNVILLILACTTYAQDQYRAAVVEYKVNTTANFERRLLDNVQEYKKYLVEARVKDVDIIIFPEYGLTSDINITEMYWYSVEVPPPSKEILCYSSKKLSPVLKELSCATLQHGMYVVINVIERVTDSSNRTIFYNTTFVFDRYGRIISRYRKINLFMEINLTPGNETAIFESDFGAKFGVLSCYDMIQKFPGQDMLQDETITDVILATSWYSQLPFAVSVSVQSGYVISNKINMLASNENAPQYAVGGSGIYVANEHSAEVYISIGGSKMIVKDVVSPQKRSTDECYTPNPKKLPRLDQVDEIFNPKMIQYATVQENLENYTFHSINSLETHKTICSAGNYFCCTFDIKISRNSFIPNDYVYKLAIFHGVRENSGWTTLGVRVCALLACQTEDTKTCGIRLENAPGATIFDKIKISGTFETNENIHDLPIALFTNLKPVDGVSYCAKKSGSPKGKVEITMATQIPVTSILSFGIHGRIFNYDNLISGVRK